ncbi:uncharacterized protein LOC116774132 isoform X1 [Danaus plexippus]|uniref:uncharacterized protein LOC116774132 isoform X1 n=1 Tax=Danaus plexippus TaxID=13037 RepID=UPI002AB285E7|nr:uncharacterized protein LOC116774132 isoform X1 [Danaus plexippus]XP_061379710.1 uncharacterized protein LOC116774132 isoform X1 [Danaus plexippus]XP_061379711.1 uncharacterized protein LOC116774132 isoform X1 [Danaus plexippus]
MGLTQERNDGVQQISAECKARAQPQEKIRSGSTKPRRPDRAVYVPRALRSNENTDDRDKKINTDSKCPKSPAEKSAQATPKRSQDKQFCNVYTPPHLRNQRSQNASQATNEAKSVPSVPISDSAIHLSDNIYNYTDDSSFYIGDYFSNGQLGLYRPGLYDYGTANYEDSWRSNDSDEVNMAVQDNQHNVINNEYIYSKDEDVDEKELKRASQEINRSSKRIIKQSFDSDVLVISDPIEEDPSPKKNSQNDVEIVENKEPEKKIGKPKLEAKVSLKREENDWDAVFDESGECLDPSLLEELTSTVGKVHISKTKNSYDQYQTRGQALFNGPYDETFGHVVEVYDFPSEFKTNDLLSLFSEYKDTGFEIKWVDDTHALIVFSSAKIAAEVLSIQRSLVKCRPLHAATLESRNKAKKCAEFLQPYRQRPETCTALARRLVSGALGVKLSTARQERAEERRIITLAREKKRQAALHKEAAWDGSLADHCGGAAP